jgi:group I intron endonuclease
MIGIYKIISPNNRIYIGQSKNITKRFEAYTNLKNCINQIRLYRSFLKHGINNHVFEIIEICDILNLNEKERYWQEYYNVLSENGLNCLYTKTDEKPKIMSEKTKLKMSNSKKGKKLDLEICNKISNSNKGRQHSELVRQKISKTMTGRKRPEVGKKVSKALIKHYQNLENRKNLNANLRKAVNQYDLEGNFIKTFESLSDILRTFGINTSAISNCCKGKRKTAGGYKWEYFKA